MFHFLAGSQTKWWQTAWKQEAKPLIKKSGGDPRQAKCHSCGKIGHMAWG